jgi:DNA-binding beta-propeller fold protein YncE
MKSKAEVNLKDVLKSFNSNYEHEDLLIQGKRDLFLNEFNKHRSDEKGYSLFDREDSVLFHNEKHHDHKHVNNEFEVFTNKLTLDPNQSVSLELLDSIGLVGAEISAYDKDSQKFFVTTPKDGLVMVDASDPTDLKIVTTIDFSSVPFSFGNDVNSVAAKNGLIAVAIANTNKTDTGKVFIIDANGELLASFDVGALPDMLTFSPDGKKLLVANEAERSNGDGSVDPDGTVSIIDLSKGLLQATVTNVGFESFNGQEQALRDLGVRIFNGKTVSQDLEPEYIAIAPNGKTAMVTLQEANAVAILDIEKGVFTKIVPLGTKEYQGLLTDFSDKDGGYLPVSDIPVFGMYMPDAIASFKSDGETYYITANEGDDRDDFIAGGEKARLATLNLDDTLFPNEATLLSNSVLGRLNTPNPAQVGAQISGDTDGDGDIDKILSYGTRSFSILDSMGNVVFDSGDHIERFIATQGIFDSKNPSTSGAFDDTRSDDKGPEPEGVTVSVVGDRTLAFVGLERGGGGVMVYDITEVENVQFVTYARNAADISPEGLTFVKAEDSATGQALLATSNEVSNTLSVFGLTRIAQGDSSNNVLKAFAGVDELTGGAGKDRFDFNSYQDIGNTVNVHDIITDFMSGQDKIDLKDIDADLSRRGDQSFKLVNEFTGRSGELMINNDGTSTFVNGDVDGDRQHDFIIELTGLPLITSADFIY